MPSDIATLALLALALAALWFWIHGDIGLNLSDEGLHWYVTSRTAAGDVPVRDVRSYDPGRYYWGALWFTVFGPGIRSLRLSLAAFQAIGLFLGLLLLRRVVRSWPVLIALGVVMTAWMFPRYKVFESTIVLTLIFAAVGAIERPRPGGFLVGGLVAGLAAFLRIDHGLYGMLGFGLLAVVVSARLEDRGLGRRLLMQGLGFLVGYSPMLVMFGFVPGFAAAFVEHHLVYISQIVSYAGNTNLPLEVPWLWRALPRVPALGAVDAAALLSRSVLFTFLPLLYAGAAAFLVARRRERLETHALLLGAFAVGVWYLHYAYSRADVEHLALGVLPLLVGGAGLVPSVPGAAGGAAAASLPVIVALSWFTVGLESPFVFRWRAPAGAYVRSNLAGAPLWLNQTTIAIIQAARRISEQTVRPGEELLIVPVWPGLYPLLGRVAPSHEVYFVYPESPERQLELVIRMKARNVNWVLFGDIAVDGRVELRFQNAQPIVWRYLTAEFDRLPVDDRYPWIHLLHRRRAAS